MAEYERAKMIERHRRGKLHAALAGTVNVLIGAPYGYRLVPKYAGHGQARYELVPEEAQVVRQLFAWVGRDRVTIGEVCRRLTQAGEVTRTGKTMWDRSVGVGHVEESCLYGDRCVWEDPHKTRCGRGCGRSVGARCSHGAPYLDRRCPPGRSGITIPVPAMVEPEIVCGGPGAIAGQSTSRPAISAGDVLSAPGPSAVPALWLCVLWDTAQSQCPQGQTPGVRLLSMLGHRCVSLWRRADLSEYPTLEAQLGKLRQGWHG